MESVCDCEVVHDYYYVFQKVKVIFIYHCKSMSEVKYYTVEFARKKAVVSINFEKKVVTAIHCTNSVFCNRFRLAIDECPQYCEVIAEVKKFVFRRRRARAAIHEIENEEVNKEAENIRNLMPLRAEVSL
jgi:hypothetical protein